MMNQIEYIIVHCIGGGWRSIGYAFRNWCDLMMERYEGYGILEEDDDAEECREWFWLVLGEDNVYDKEFLEGLEEMIKRIDSGEDDMLMYCLEDIERLGREVSDGNV